jgi:DNA-binding MarR family transcriptional regulator
LELELTVQKMARTRRSNDTDRPARIADRPSGQPPETSEIPDPFGWAFGYVFKEAHRAFSDAFRDQLKPYGITLGQWYFLRELWDEDGLTQRELSRRVGVREPTTGTAIELMEGRKLVMRKRKAQDHRSLYVYLTPKGRALREGILVLAKALNKKAIRGFTTTEVADIRRKVFQMIDNLQSD